MDIASACLQSILSFHPVILIGVSLIVVSALLYAMRPMSEFLVIIVTTAPYVIITLLLSINH
jgi:hypothetical protein